MTRLAAALLLALGLSLPGHAQPADGVESVIQRQIDAFLADDFETAFTFASPGIKRLFGTPENFGRMVRNGYPMVWRPSEVEFGPRERRGEVVLQRVRVLDQTGRMHVLLYQMTPDGESWQINGVQILESAQVGV
jgi:hypothetical protein